MSYTIVVANQKGGVAKTTTVVSMAGALTLSGKHILVIDLDAQADLTLAFGLNPKAIRNSIAEALLSTQSLLSIIRRTSIPTIDLIPSNEEMDLAERFLPIRRNYEGILHNLIQSSVASSYDFILIDCPPALGAATINAFHAADMLIIPTQPEYFSAHALRNMMPLIKRVRNNGNPNLVYRILITMHDRRNRIHRSLNEQLRATFQEGLLQTRIDVDTKLRESSLAGLPVTHFRTKTRSSLQYQALVEEIMNYVEKTNVQPVFTANE